MNTILVGAVKQPVTVDDDFVKPEGWSLNISSTGHVRMLKATGVRRPSGSYIYKQKYLHRWIMKAPKGKEVLFIDRDRLNLQRENLFVCEPGENVRANPGHTSRTGRFKGVHWCKLKNTWKAQITHNYHCYSLGSFSTEEHAASAYNLAAVRLHGPHAYVNILPEDDR